ncbi:MAG TPA: alpha/beta hydrolase-fold protein [Spirochaetales bacterium]|nr:alpha/beta hydrolase-fold protein [Spirochaetales bacterium]
MKIEIETLRMPQLGMRERTVRVLLPPGYEVETGRRYPVLYMQDGHNLFDPATATYGTHWAIGETMDALAASGEAGRWIVVGVDCNHGDRGMKRLDEYSPWVNAELGLELSRAAGRAAAGGEGRAYLDFLADTLKPWVDGRYRTLPGPASTGIAGSSMGALFSLYALHERPDVFSLAGAFSTAAWFAMDELVAHIESRFRPDRAVYLDIGTLESSDPSKPEFPKRYLDETLALRELYRAKGLPPERLLCVVDEGADHSERSWARRFPAFARWALDRLEGARG